MSDLEVIHEIETILDRKLFEKPFDPDKLRYKKAYSLNQAGHVIHLGLSACGLYDLQPLLAPLKALSQLQTLYLSYNQISDYSFLKELGQLQTLDLSSNRISDYSFLKELGQLQTLDLSSNRISDYSFLKELGQLQSLDLRGNQINDILFLGELGQLQTLNLSSNQINGISFLGELGQLQTLNLSSNQISDISFLKELGQLQSLNLWNNLISDISFLKELRQLQSLDLGSNQISDISFLKELGQLQSLNLWENLISDISFLKELGQLQSLDLSRNQISDISFLKELRQLQTLYLSENQISDYSFLKELGQLQSLNLWANQISDSSFLKELGQLQSLHLSENQISDISFLKELGQLQSLHLSESQISDISFLKELGQLQSLNLWSNQISDISFLEELGQLQTLDLSRNQISDISFLKELGQLQTLDLSRNQISDISFLKELRQLQTLDLSSNQISDISVLQELPTLEMVNLSQNKLFTLPTWMTKLGLGINPKDERFLSALEHGDIILGGNPIKTPPPEIVKQGKQSIRNFFQEVAKGEMVTLKEVKVLLVGEGMAGKTSLLKRLQGLDFDAKESQTHGINVVTLAVDQILGLSEKSDLKDCLIHCWDFGGQEIMHASHQFFLSERALYILVLDSRTDSKKYHWLRHIEKFGGDSPLIVVINKIDDNPHYDLERKSLNDAFPTIQQRFFRISCNTKENLSDLFLCIAKTIPETSLFGSQISRRWLTIKERLVQETEASHYIDRQRFQEICQEHGVDDESSQHTLLQYLHDLGIVLYFKEIDLTSIYVLDPHWVTIGVYKIINSQAITDGILCTTELDHILNQEAVKKDEYDPARDKLITYSPEEQRYILHIMMQFELCYEYNKQAGLYIVPDLLPKELDEEPALDEEGTLRFILKYDYLPKSIISRLMVRLQDDINAGQQWRSGMFLYNATYGCRAKVHANEQEKLITITVVGEPNRKREYLSVIRHCITTINRQFENLRVDAFIPLPGYPQAWVKYQVLLGHEREGWEEYRDGELGKTFSVSVLLDNVVSPAERAKERIEERLPDVYIDRVDSIYPPEPHPILTQIPPSQSPNSDAVEQVKSLYDKLTDLQEKIEVLDEKKRFCEDEAKTRIQYQKWLLFTALFIMPFGILVWYIYHYNWDVMEPYTYIVPTSLLILESVLAFLWFGTSNFADAFENRLKIETKKRYAKYEYPAAQHERLKRQLIQVKGQLEKK